MNKFGAWLFNFMKGRYGFDQLGQALSIGVVVCWIISIIFGVLANLFGLWAAWVSTILNWAGLALLLLMLFRMLSRNTSKRRAENEAYLQRKQRRARDKKASSKDMSTKNDAKDLRNYKYLTCSFCGQQMRVPRGKGKIAVKCPSCGEKTIVKS